MQSREQEHDSTTQGIKLEDGADQQNYIQYLRWRKHPVWNSCAEEDDMVEWKICHQLGTKDVQVEAYCQSSQGVMLPYGRLPIFNIEGLARLYAGTDWEEIPKWIRKGPDNMDRKVYQSIFRYKHQRAERPDTNSVLPQKDICSTYLFDDFVMSQYGETDGSYMLLDQAYTRGLLVNGYPIPDDDPRTIDPGDAPTSILWDIETTIETGIQSLRADSQQKIDRSIALQAQSLRSLEESQKLSAIVSELQKLRPCH